VCLGGRGERGREEYEESYEPPEIRRRGREDVDAESEDNGMNSFKRQARRVAAVGVGVGLLVLGLEAPAFAATVVTAVAPGSGPTNCVVDITGTGFLDFPKAQQTLNFVGPAAGTGDDVLVVTWTRISATEIWATVPTLAPGTTYTVQLTDPSGTNTAGGTFLSTTGAGGCAPTIASFAPTCGAAGTVVTITGTNLLGPTLGGGEVAFSPYGATEIAANTAPDVSSPTNLSVIVPDTAGDGPLRVTTFGAATGGRVFSSTNFLVPPPDCTSALPFARSITLRLRDALVARGKVTAAAVTPAAPAGCTAAVPVKIQRRVSGGWRTVGKTTTTDTGAYRKKIRNRHGKYRSLAPKITLTTGEVCGRAVSRAVKH
jgi:hypothetical protein